MIRRLANGKNASQMVLFERRFEVPDYDNPTGPPSRVRWRLIHTPWFGIYVHKWLKPDPRPTLHDHPWPFVSLILSGQYLEARKGASHWRRRINVVRMGQAHTVTTLVNAPVWTVMFVGRTRPTWGYHTESGWVDFRDHPHSTEFAEALATRREATR